MSKSTSSSLSRRARRRPTGRLLLALVAVVCGLLAATATTATATPRELPVPTTPFLSEIRNTYFALGAYRDGPELFCVVPAADSHASPVMQGPCNYAWDIEPRTDGNYLIKTEANRLCLDTADGNIMARARIVVGRCSGSPSQVWSFVGLTLRPSTNHDLCEAGDRVEDAKDGRHYNYLMQCNAAAMNLGNQAVWALIMHISEVLA